MSAAAAPADDRAPTAAFELVAPPHWRAIDFISDLHLAEDMPRTFAAWADHLEHTPADAVVVLGDLFELWVGDDAREHPFAARCLQAMAQAARRRSLHVMVGNRDFLLGAAAMRQAGAAALPDPALLLAFGQRILLTHGDALCLGDAAYQAFRAQVRSLAWQREFLERPLEERLRIGREIRQASQMRRSFDGDASADIDAGEALRWLHAHAATQLVHGHTHRPQSAALAPGLTRHVLSDWDLDHEHAAPRAEVMRLSPGGFARVAPAGG